MAAPILLRGFPLFRLSLQLHHHHHRIADGTVSSSRWQLYIAAIESTRLDKNASSSTNDSTLVPSENLEPILKLIGDASGGSFVKKRKEIWLLWAFILHERRSGFCGLLIETVTEIFYGLGEAFFCGRGLISEGKIVILF